MIGWFYSTSKSKGEAGGFICLETKLFLQNTGLITNAAEKEIG